MDRALVVLAKRDLSSSWGSALFGSVGYAWLVLWLRMDHVVNCAGRVLYRHLAVSAARLGAACRSRIVGGFSDLFSDVPPVCIEDEGG